MTNLLRSAGYIMCSLLFFGINGILSALGLGQRTPQADIVFDQGLMDMANNALKQQENTLNLARKAYMQALLEQRRNPLGHETALLDPRHSLEKNLDGEISNIDTPRILAAKLTKSLNAGIPLDELEKKANEIRESAAMWHPFMSAAPNFEY